MAFSETPTELTASEPGTARNARRSLFWMVVVALVLRLVVMSFLYPERTDPYRDHENERGGADDHAQRGQDESHFVAAESVVRETDNLTKGHLGPKAFGHEGSSHVWLDATPGAERRKGGSGWEPEEKTNRRMFGYGRVESDPCIQVLIGANGLF